jgi:hypothetical protein
VADRYLRGSVFARSCAAPRGYAQTRRSGPRLAPSRADPQKPAPAPPAESTPAPIRTVTAQASGSIRSSPWLGDRSRPAFHRFVRFAPPMLARAVRRLAPRSSTTSDPRAMLPTDQSRASTSPVVAHRSSQHHARRHDDLVAPLPLFSDESRSSTALLIVRLLFGEASRALQSLANASVERSVPVASRPRVRGHGSDRGTRSCPGRSGSGCAATITSHRLSGATENRPTSACLR